MTISAQKTHRLPRHKALKMVLLWHPSSGIGAAQFIGIQLRLRSKELKPVIEVELVIKAMCLRIDKMHLANKPSEVPCMRKVLRNGLMRDGPRCRIVPSLMMVRVKACEQGYTGRSANRIRAIGTSKSDCTASKRIQIRGTRNGISGYAKAVALMLIRHDN